MSLGSKTTANSIGNPFWLSAWAVTLAVGWLLPNHTPPWGAFHQDAWVALASALIAVAVFIRNKSAIPWPTAATVCILLAIVPWIQYASGQIVFAGVAWIASLYMLGFLLALQVGATWQRFAPGQMLPYMALAFIVGSMASTGIALTQWLQMDHLSYWMIETGHGRPFGNLGQPNQLGTLLCWGLAAFAWLWLSDKIGTSTWIFASCFLLFGIALTESRTSWVILLAFGLLSIHWRRHSPMKPLLKCGSVLLFFFVTIIFLLPTLSELLLLPSYSSLNPDALQARFMSEARPMIWKSFIDAALNQPITGYGWNQTSIAQLSVLLDHPDWRVIFSHSHNLLLDLIIWMGIPTGMMVSLFLLWKFLRFFLQSKTNDEMMVFMVLTSTAIHAMLELPLHYAYMLLPAGMLWGFFEAGTNSKSLPVHRGKLTHIGLLIFTSIALSTVIHDYLKVQTSYEWLRYEWGNKATKGTAPVPNTILLTQWPAFVRLSHRDLSSSFTPEEFIKTENLAHLFPSAGFLMQLAGMQMQNNQKREAHISLRQACQLHGESQCIAIKNEWQRKQNDAPALSGIDWSTIN